MIKKIIINLLLFRKHNIGMSRSLEIGYSILIYILILLETYCIYKVLT